MRAAELTIGGLARRFTLRLPSGANGKIPLVLVLHGMRRFDAADVNTEVHAV